MKSAKIQFIITSIICLFFLNCNQKPERNLYPETLVGGLELLPSEKTGIDFNNSIKESTYFNHYYYSQMYVGSGVAIGDINNDGLPDVFFGGNQVTDRLYLNKGDFQFEDITKKSKVAKNSGWTWGVTMADVNADGYLDLYVSRNGISAKPEDKQTAVFTPAVFKSTIVSYTPAAGIAKIPKSTPLGNSLISVKISRPSISPLFLPTK